MTSQSPSRSGPNAKASRRRGGFVLVTVVLLVALLASTGVGLAQFSVSHQHRSVRSAASLDHELAVDSLLACLPLLEGTKKSTGAAEDTPPIELTVGAVDVRCRVAQESGKLLLAGDGNGQAVAEQLRRLAGEHKLPVEHIVVRPVQSKQDAKDLPAILSFDQIVRPRGFEEIYHREPIRTDWAMGPSEYEPVGKRPKSWTDVVTLWQNSKHTLISLEICTKLGNDQRWWYLVCYIDDGKTHTICRLQV